MGKDNKEWISGIAAAQRLEKTIQEIEEMVEKKELEGKIEFGVLYVTKESVYTYSGLNAGGRQTKKRRGRAPASVNIKTACHMLNVDADSLHNLMENGIIELVHTPRGTEVSQRSINKRLDVLKKKEHELGQEAKKQDKKKDPYPGMDKHKEEAKEVETIPLLEEQREEMDMPELDPEPIHYGDEDMKEEQDPVQTKSEKSVRIDETKTTENVGPSLREVMGIVLPQLEELAADMEEMLQHADRPMFTKTDMKEVANVAYMKGKLAVYESMESFERRVK